MPTPYRATRRLLVLALATLVALVAFAGPALGDATSDEAARRTQWQGDDDVAHFGEFIHRVLWGWVPVPRTPVEEFFEYIRRGAWDEADNVAHWDEAVRRFLFDQAHPTQPTVPTTQPPATTTTAPTTTAPTTTTKPLPRNQMPFIAEGAWYAMLDTAQFKLPIATYEFPRFYNANPQVLGVTSCPGTVWLYEKSFIAQDLLDYVIAHESGHVVSCQQGIPADVRAAIEAISHPETEEAWADCYAQKRIARFPNTGYWNCPPNVLALVP